MGDSSSAGVFASGRGGSPCECIAIVAAWFELLLINPEHYKAVRGKKTDLKDGERIAELLQDGRLAGSYVPPVAIRVLRDLTRYRTKLVQYQSSIANRI
ncbi:MAG: transposase [Terriglobales bacterium]